MSKAVLAGVLLAGCVTGSAAMAANVEVEAPIHQFYDASARGDATAQAAAFLPSVTIMDSVPPHSIWQGNGAFAAWSADATAWEKGAKAAGLSDPKLALGDVINEVVTGDNAYVVADTTYAFRQNGVAMRAVARSTFSLSKTANGWKIAGFSWAWPPCRREIGTRPPMTVRPACPRRSD
ncbi:MAG TPA: nuclear transport factor 2 family protein [Phenylobacterium sp.]|jgi:ketosteroid isomerase-like protein